MAGINHDREMAETLDGGNQAQVECVARMIGKSAHAALTQNHVVVAFAHYVLGGHEKFFESSGHAAFQQHGFAPASGALEQRKVLHIACADLDYVGVFLDQLQRFAVDCLGDDL